MEYKALLPRSRPSCHLAIPSEHAAHRLLVATIVLVQLMHGPAGAADAEPQPFLEGLAFPTNMALLPDGTLLYTEKETGSVRVVTPGGELLHPPFITLAVMPSAECGLLGIAVHPDFDRASRGSTSAAPTLPTA